VIPAILLVRMSAPIGDDSSLHLSSVRVKVVVSHTGISGSGHFSLESRPEVLVYTESRSLASILGQVSVSVRGPSSPAKSTASSVTIVPDVLTTWPTTVALVDRAPESVNLISSLYLEQQSRTLSFHPAINTQLKPQPLVGRKPAVAYAYNITGGATTDQVLIEVSFNLSLSGVDYVSPW